MFDDLKQQNNQAGAVPQASSVPQAPPPPQAPGQPIVDMFDTVDTVAQNNQVRPSAVQSGKIRPVSNTTFVPGQQSAPVDPLMFTEPAGNKLNKIIIILVVVLLVLALGAGAYYLIVVKGKIKTPTNDNQNTNQVVNTNTNTNTNTNDNTNQADTTDSDSDGLTDEEEGEYKTNALLADTDGDGLSDREEIKTYKTDPLTMDTDVDGLNDGDEVKIWNSDPLKLDTDGDSYPDGDEVKNGYSPIGPGKLATSTPEVVIDNPENTTVTAAMSWGMRLLRPINQCYQSTPTAALTDYSLGADICNPKANQNWPARPDSYTKVCVLDKVIQDNTWLIGLQSNSPDTLSSVICSQMGCQRASTVDYPGGKVCP